ncbi:MAG: flagellar basal body L-ring protein FlgH [Alphaproteobacteria bacterium]|nr:flagellar basal body L-ring protein FlgH [Alphaproteobacteria bacterium]
MRLPLLRVAALLGLAALASCGSLSRLAEVGEPPAMKPVTTPLAQPNYSAALVPMPKVPEPVYGPNSLWAAGSKTFFKDPRAARVGDILTIEIQIADEAQVDNTTTRNRTNSEDTGITALAGFESYLQPLLPGVVDPANLAGVESSSTQEGSGSVNRKEEVNLTVAAIVVDVLPNGNLVIQGRQEVRVNFELRELLVSGIVRPEDISNTNTIQHTQIAEARISYGGRGQITDMQQPRYGQQVLDILMPF